MDYKRLAAETIAAVRHATAKEDEEYGGEVLHERLTTALEEAGIDLSSKEDLEGTWFGAPDDILFELIEAIIQDPAMNDVDDPGVSRIFADLYNALNENPHLEDSHPDFWQKSTEVL
jgi:hypothetical protein